jgi:hypothetical protein
MKVNVAGFKLHSERALPSVSHQQISQIMADVEFQRSLREDTQFHGSKLGAIYRLGWRLQWTTQ